PERLSEVQAFLTELLRFQCLMVGAVGGVVFLGAGAARRGGLAARYLLSPEDSAAARHAELSAALGTGGAPLGRREGSAERGGAEGAGGAALGRLEGRAGGAGAAAAARNGRARRPGGVESLSRPRPGGLYEAEPSYRAIAFPLVAGGRAEGACVLVVPAR